MKYSIELHRSKGDIDEDDYTGKTVFKEDRYIILDENGMDFIGVHMTLNEALKNLKDIIKN